MVGRTVDWIAVLTALAWAALVGTLAVLRHQAFNTNAYDMAIYDQVLWNTAQGRFFQISITPDTPLYLARHFSPLLVVLVPLYWVRPDPTTLLATQALLLGLAGLPLYWLARDKLHSSWLGLSVLAAYLLQPATAYVALFDFHQVALAAPLLSLALYLVLSRRDTYFVLVVGLLFLIKEEMGLVGAALGILVILLQRRWRIGLSLAVGGVMWTLVIVRLVIPRLNPAGVYIYDALYATLGSTPREMVLSALHDPGSVVDIVLAPDKVEYLQKLLVPLGGLPLLGAPVLGVALPVLASVLLTDKMPPELIRLQYSATLLPPLIAATALGLSWLRAWAGRFWQALAPAMGAFLVGSSILGAYLYGPLPGAREFNLLAYQPSPRLNTARQIMALIPADASIVAQSNLLPQLCHRRVAQLFGYSDPKLRPDYYFIDTDPSVVRYPYPQDWDRPYAEAVERLRADANYKVAAEAEGYLLLERDNTPYVGQRLDTTFGDSLVLVGYDLRNEEVAPGEILSLKLWWEARRHTDTNYTAFVHLIDSDGRLWSQRDDYPAGKFLPTSEWKQGDLWQAEWPITVPADTPPGDYRLIAGLYNLETMQRLPLTEGGQRGDDHITLGAVRVTERSAKTVAAPSRRSTVTQLVAPSAPPAPVTRQADLRPCSPVWITSLWAISH